jgi:hypothetical protein
VTLLEQVAGFLISHDIPNALIGAAALAVHGVSRSTLDQDLLVVDRHVLDASFWTGFTGAELEVRRGDDADQLAGVVRIRAGDERDVDVVVGRSAWQEAVLGRATRIGAGPLCVVEVADLILLKLYAGGSQDRWDIEQLLALDQGATAAVTVEQRIAPLPERSRQMWIALRGTR